jgi:hypothetical protein
MKPPFGIVFGPSKTGKTLCVGAAAAGGLIVAAPGALLPLTTHLGIEKLNEKRVAGISDVIATLKSSEAKRAKFVYVDDLSIIVDRSFKGNWNELGDNVLATADATRDLTESGIPVFFTMHEQPPRESSGKHVRGGPSLPGQYPEKFSALADVVLRVVPEPTASPWPFVFWSRARPEWLAGDRLSIFPDGCPLNIAEGLRARGIDVPRAIGFEWMDAAVEKVSIKLEADIDNWREILREWMKANQSKKPIPHLRWAASDALHRTIFKRSLASPDDWLKAPDDGIVTTV